MTAKRFAEKCVGLPVTWGTGAPRGRVVSVDAKTLVATVELTQESSSPCGRAFPVGARGEFPIAELRAIN